MVLIPRFSRGPLGNPGVVRALLVALWVAVAVTAYLGWRRRDDGPRPDAAGSAAADAKPSPAASIRAALTGAPDEPPAMLNAAPPFRYPSALYAARVQGNVTLRLFVDSTGRVVGDSTRVEEPSGHAALDSAALRGAGELRFSPARRDGTPMAVSLLYPVYFRHPDAPPLPGDSVLKRQ